MSVWPIHAGFHTYQFPDPIIAIFSWPIMFDVLKDRFDILCERYLWVEVNGEERTKRIALVALEGGT
jgi:hypothetical protein